MGTRFYSANENAIEWLRDEERITVTFSDPHFVAVVKRLAKKYPNEIEITGLPSNNGGYLCAHLPVAFLRLQAPAATPERTDEQIENARQFLREYKKSKNNDRAVEGN